MSKIKEIRAALHSKAQNAGEKNDTARFFKTAPGNYANHDQFLGVKVPILRKIAQQCEDITFSEIKELLHSPFNEERLLALIILVNNYNEGNTEDKNKIYQFYLDNIDQVNNWNLVDASAPFIVGAYLQDKEKNILMDLAHSPNIWKRRITIIATLYFIRKNSFEWTFKIAEILLKDSHDLIHKATGWMLREAGKKNQEALLDFLDENATKMPRTMLRYAIEKLPEDIRKSYLLKK